MKNKILTILLVVSVIFGVLFVNADKLLNPTYTAMLLQDWGKNPFPDLLGGYTFGEKFSETSKALVELGTFPLRLVYWIGQQTATFFKWARSASWIGSDSRPSGFGGGVYA